MSAYDRQDLNRRMSTQPFSSRPHRVACWPCSCQGLSFTTKSLSPPIPVPIENRTLKVAEPHQFLLCSAYWSGQRKPKGLSLEIYGQRQNMTPSSGHKGSCLTRHSLGYTYHDLLHFLKVIRASFPSIKINLNV